MTVSNNKTYFSINLRNIVSCTVECQNGEVPFKPVLDAVGFGKMEAQHCLELVNFSPGTEWRRIWLGPVHVTMGH